MIYELFNLANLLVVKKHWFPPYKTVCTDCGIAAVICSSKIIILLLIFDKVLTKQKQCYNCYEKYIKHMFDI
jgi:hypothetical protein